MKVQLLNRVENIVAKGELACCEQFMSVCRKGLHEYRQQYGNGHIYRYSSIAVPMTIEHVKGDSEGSGGTAWMHMFA